MWSRPASSRERRQRRGALGPVGTLVLQLPSFALLHPSAVPLHPTVRCHRCPRCCCRRRLLQAASDVLGVVGCRQLPLLGFRHPNPQRLELLLQPPKTLVVLLLLLLNGRVHALRRPRAHRLHQCLRLPAVLLQHLRMGLLTGLGLHRLDEIRLRLCIQGLIEVTPRGLQQLLDILHHARRLLDVLLVCLQRHISLRGGGPEAMGLLEATGDLQDDMPLLGHPCLHAAEAILSTEILHQGAQPGKLDLRLESLHLDGLVSRARIL
mmetsp:Transcript_57981/g.166255  ORF Transcript_57981/g.166255 Transcript_57981/m.166255 type:complete len:265 (-) Transcript_57981:289-1083(-)